MIYAIKAKKNLFYFCLTSIHSDEQVDECNSIAMLIYAVLYIASLPHQMHSIGLNIRFTILSWDISYNVVTITFPQDVNIDYNCFANINGIMFTTSSHSHFVNYNWIFFAVIIWIHIHAKIS